jgi:hypothetical protein
LPIFPVEHVLQVALLVILRIMSQRTRAMRVYVSSNAPLLSLAPSFSETIIRDTALITVQLELMEILILIYAYLYAIARHLRKAY